VRIPNIRLHVLLALSGLPVAAFSQGTAALNWSCESCVLSDGWQWDIEAGPAFLADDAFRYGDYTGLDEDGVYVFGDVFGRFWGEDASYMIFEAYMRGIDSGALFFKGGKQSKYEVRASYQAIPRKFFTETMTPYSGGASLVLPDNWIRAPSTQQMTELSKSSTPVAIGWDWDIFGLGVDYKPAQRWQLSADYSRREREGLKRVAGSFSFNAAEFAAPIDYTTDDLQLSATYAAETWQASATYFGSVFSNANDSLTWDNAYSWPAGVNMGQLALPADNTSHQFSLAGSMLLPARTTLNGQLSFGELSQNEALLTTGTINGKVDTMNFNLRATSSPWRQVTIEGELRYNDFDNRTTAQFSNIAYDYQRQEFKVRGEYRLRGGMKLYAGFDNEKFERNRQERTNTTTNRLWFTIRTRLGDIADLHMNLFADDRDGSTYEATVNPLTPENPMMRKYNMADRQRNGARLHGSVFVGERSDFGWEVEFGSDDYNNSAIGLTNSDYLRFGADFSYLFHDATSLYASFYREEITTEQQNSQSFSLPDWSATTDDRFTTVTLGIIYPQLLSRLDANLEYGWADSRGESNSDTSGLPASFPELRSNRQNLNLGLSYPYSDSLTLRFDYIFESMDSDDWALDGVNSDTIPNLLALGADAWNYHANIFYVSARWVIQ